MSNKLRSKRPLASLTPEECQTLFALAFGYAPPLEHLFTFCIAGPLTIGFEGKSIILYPSGALMCADTSSPDSGVYFDARKLITQLDAYNVTFGYPQEL